MTNTTLPIGHDLPLSPAPRARAFSLRCRRALVAAVVATLFAGVPADAARRGKAPRCAGGHFVVDGAPLVPGAGPDAVMVGAGTVATASGCPTTPASRFRRGPRGDQLVVRWAACGATRGVTLRATIAADCRSVAGSIKAKGGKRRRFTAQEHLPADLSQPWDTSVAPLPDGAVMVNPIEFLEASRRPGFRVVTPGTIAGDAAAATADDAANQETIERFVAAHPERAEAMSIGVDPNDADLVTTEDGNYALTVYDADGNPTEVVTMGPVGQRAMRAQAVRTFPSRENQLAIYAQRHAAASDTLGLDLPSPDALADRPVEEIVALNAEVARRYPLAEAGAPAPGETAPAWYPARCTLEIGAGDGSDGSAVCAHAREGLWNTASWPLKYWDTCTKAQASRGSCVAFAITAGREVQVARRYERWINLSEQHLYYMAKQFYQPAMYGDGLDGSRLLQQILDDRYGQPLEERWTYNPSNARVGDDATATYTNSCNGYAGTFCSDTAGQGRFMCIPTAVGTVCAFAGAPAAGITVRSTSQPAELWDNANPDDSLLNLLYAINVTTTPVVIGFDVVTTFDSPNPNGFVRHHAGRPKLCATDPATNACAQTTDCQCSRGGHAALVVGFLRNDKLPEGAPTGAGGGYFIVKNSWGCSGDGGYYYLPVEWVKRFVHTARALGDVETSAPLPDQPVDDFRFDYRPVPPTIRVVQPLVGERYVEGQQVPLAIDGADFQHDGYALLGETRWTSNVQGPVGTGASTLATLAAGTHQLVASYTGKTGAVATAATTVVVGPRPANVPPTAVFFDYRVGSGAECAQYCPYGCALGYGFGLDPEDGTLTADASVRWFVRLPGSETQLVATGASAGTQAKFLGCIPNCGGTHTFTLQVVDSAGQPAEARRELSTAACVR